MVLEKKDILKTIKNIYFLGIGGIGMSALARYFKLQGYEVAGYDRTPSPLTEKLQQEGILINYTDEVNEIPEIYKDINNTLVIYTPAVPADNQQKNYFQQAGFQLYKRSQVLGLLSRNGKALCVAGTHGKTTISTMLAYIMKNSAVGCNAFLGGIAVNFDSNLLLDKNSPYIVIEADEFDRSFLQLEPEMAVISSMDADHLDIYGDKNTLEDAFEQFASQIRQNGKLFIKKGLSISRRQVEGYYGMSEDADYYASNLRLENGRYTFDYHGKKGEIKDIQLGISGKINVENAVAAITMALEAGVTGEEIKASLPHFKGILRRFNIQAENKVIYIDDYAHHPREIEAVLTSVKEMWSDKKLTVAFQPHLYTRTNDFYEWFAKSLDIADEIILLPIYPARELPMPGVTSEMINKEMAKEATLVKREDFLEYIQNNIQDGIFMTLGAGDIDRFVPKLKKWFEKN